ncbi:MAG: hypothetical protein IPJ30_16535 [Acidobacteria bacterium]|nr:hypothetical protein [Acidobacteriota bacterium]
MANLGFFVVTAASFARPYIWSIFTGQETLRRVNQALTEAQIAEEAALREREKRLAEIEPFWTDRD